MNNTSANNKSPRLLTANKTNRLALCLFSLIIILSFLLPSCAPAPYRLKHPDSRQPSARHRPGSIEQGESIPRSISSRNFTSLSPTYLVFLPDGYNSSGGQEWPLILYLHGNSHRGTNINVVRQYGLPYYLTHRDRFPVNPFPFIVVAPQCANGPLWENQPEILAVLDEVMRLYRVDRSRIYLTGMSSGGRGTWHLASNYPSRFAAIAPIAGYTQVSWAQGLKQMPIWAFHGARDTVCPVSESNEMIAAVKRSGNSRAGLTVYRSEGHNIVNKVYAREDVYTWFLKWQK